MRVPHACHASKTGSDAYAPLGTVEMTDKILEFIG